jgi:hypothetical protein
MNELREAILATIRDTYGYDNSEIVTDAIMRLIDSPPHRAAGTAEDCEVEMRRLTNGERGCANPAEHAARPTLDELIQREFG